MKQAQSTISFLGLSLLFWVISLQGATVPDPYIWLENDEDARTQEWLVNQKQMFDEYNQSHTDRSETKALIEKMKTYDSCSIPTQCGNAYFFTKDQILYRQEGLQGIPQVLIDLDLLGYEPHVSLENYVPSPDGQYLAYGLAKNGSDWITWKVLNIPSGENLTDRIEKIKFDPVAWTPDSLGFYYARFDDDGINRVYYHALGTSQASDKLVLDSQNPEFFVEPFISSDHQYLMIDVLDGSSGPSAILYRDLNDHDGSFKTLSSLDGPNLNYLCNQGSNFYFSTYYKAPFGRVIELNVSNHTIRDVIQESSHQLDHIFALGNYLVVVYTHNVKPRIYLFDLEGKQLQEIPLPTIGSVSFNSSRRTQLQVAKEFFLTFTNFVQPSAIYRHSIESGQLTLFKKPENLFDRQDYVIRQVFCQSKDGTHVPLFIVHKMGVQLDGNNPTLLYGYGGFGVSIEPYYSSLHMAWIESGGILAIANIRGGFEYGIQWHKGGMWRNKQNCFDDFIAAAEWLITLGYTKPSKLAIQGASNGGLLAAVCLNQRPELFGAAVVEVGLLDMLRFPLFTVGHFWISEYGDPEDPEDFKVLYSYSPYHNVQAGTHYPATLITTADHDDRVVPLHSYKYAAAMQEAQGGKRKILLRVETQAGHGGPITFSQAIEEATDILLFLKREIMENNNDQ